MTYISKSFWRHSLGVCKLIQNGSIILVCVSVLFNFDLAGLSLVTFEFLLFSGVNFDTSGLVGLLKCFLVFCLFQFGIFEIISKVKV